MSITKKSPDLIPCIFIIAATLFVYFPALEGGFIWDDNCYITDNKSLRSFDGLKNIWLDVKASPQYYPMVFTSFWTEYYFWQLKPFGYHLSNVLLHSFSAILLLFVLRSLSIQGAWLIAIIFAVHPVHVESVAWITERKNVLSGLFYMSSLLAYIRFSNLHKTGSPLTDKNHADQETFQYRFYSTAIVLFLCALLSKSITASLPAVILLLLWWKKDQLIRKDIIPLVPFFVIGIVAGLMTVWLEKFHVGAQGKEWTLSLVDRFLVAGRALWFYAGKLIWPVNLTFIYPRWEINSGVWWQYLFPFGAIIIVAAFFFLRRQFGKGPLAALLIFAGTLAPALGFIDIYPFAFSFVADHFQYLASIGLIVLFTALLQKVFGLNDLELKLSEVKNGTKSKCLLLYYSVAGVILCLLGTLTWHQGHIYKNLEILWYDTIQKNPSAWMAHNNLGALLEKHGKTEEAIASYSEALKLNPDFSQAYNNLGALFFKKGRASEAIAYYSKALKITPDFAEIHYNLGLALASQGKTDEAVRHYSIAINLKPAFANVYYDLGAMLMKRGNISEAFKHFSKALELKIIPGDAEMYNNLGSALASQGKLNDAIDYFGNALKLEPNLAEVHYNLGIALSTQNRIKDARVHFSQAIKINPNYAMAHEKLKLIEKSEN